MVLLDTGTPGTSREIFSEDAYGLLSLLAQWLERSVDNRGVASSSPVISILTENFSPGTRSSCDQQNHCTSRMKS